LADSSRQYLFEFSQRSQGGLFDGCHRAGSGGAEADRDSYSLIVVEQKRRHRSSSGKRVTAGNAGRSVYRIAESTQPVDVVAHSPGGDGESLGEVVTFESAAGACVSLCGDAFADVPGAEGAFLSGMAVAEQIATLPRVREMLVRRTRAAS